MTEAESENKLGAIIARTRHLLLDFDGPVCDIFAGLPAPVVAERLRKIIPDGIQVPDTIADSPDPMEVFIWSATISDDLATCIEAELTEQEVAAAATAEPTPYVHEVITACRESGRSLAIVSNNSARAVSIYLTQHGLDGRIRLITARMSHDPALLKPDPYLINQAVAALGGEPSECALVGDSVTDVEGAQLAQIQAIAYANKPGKVERLVRSGAGAVITSLADLAILLRTRTADVRHQFLESFHMICFTTTFATTSLHVQERFISVVRPAARARNSVSGSGRTSQQ
jgi:HAD superfamily hydrolase (TIGR01509 family)